MRYTIEIQGEPVEVDVHGLGAGRYTVQVGDGESRVIDAKVDGPLVHLLQGLRTSTVRTGDRGADRHGSSAGHDAMLTVLDARAARLRARRGGALAGASDGVIRTPMPGRVVDVLVAEGDEVTEGQGVVIVEAMKMENELRATAAGTVTKVHVAAGETVEGNAPLVEITP